MNTKIKTILIVLTAVIVLSGCSGEREAAAERERQRIEAEQRAQRDLQKSNEAVGEVSRKLGREPPKLDLGLPAEEPKTEEKPSESKAKEEPGA